MPSESASILLVEDEPTLRDITAFRLELLGYEVVQVDSAQAARAQMDQDLPGLIILDIALDGGEGLELLDALSNDPRTSHVPVLVFSSVADLDDVQRSYAAGADDFLVTPYDPAVLEGKIESLLSGKGAATTLD